MPLHRRISLLAWVMPCLVLSADVARGASIGLYSTPDCSSTVLQIEEGATDTLYIRASTEGLMRPILSARFSVAGLPEGWRTTSISSPTVTVALGDPFSEAGAVVSHILPVEGPCIPFFTVIVEATTALDDVVLQVVDAADPEADCPFVHEYCPPCILETCVDGLQLFVNPTTALSKTTWTAVRMRYR